MTTANHPFGHWPDAATWPALSLRQPWLWAILELGKDVENRRWNTKYRGPIWLHAAKGCTKDEYAQAMEWMDGRAVNWRAPFWPDFAGLERGGICAIAEIFDVIPPIHLDRGGRGRGRAWHMLEQYGFLLRNVKRLPFIPCGGALGLHRLQPDIASRAREALGEAPP